MNAPSSEASPVDEPTVLLVAEGERLAPALAARLALRGMLVETASIEDAASTAFVAAPDVVVLAGDASADGGLELLAELGSRPGTSTLPIVLITDQAEDRPLHAAFRHGVVGVVDRTASADEMARRIEDIVRELPHRDGQATGQLQETSLEEVVELFAESLRSGILSVARTTGPSAQVMIRADRPVREAIAELAERIRPLLVSGDDGPLRYEFHESPMARLSSLDVFDPADADSGRDLGGRRVLLIEQNPARSDLLAQHLRAEGVVLCVVDGAGQGLELAHDLMPEVVLIDGRGVEGWATEALRAIRRDPWLRWASLLIVDTDRLWANPRRPDVAMLAPKILALVATDQDLASRVRARDSLITRLDVVGPVRLIRALSETQLGLRLVVQHPRVRVELDLADGLVAGASARAQGTKEPVDGLSALSTLLGLGSGRVHITHEEAPRTANVMTPVDDALAAAAAERPAVAPSIPPPSILPPAPEATSAADTGSLPNVMRKLEVLLDALSRTANAAEGEGAGELPEVGTEDADDEITGLYDARLVERLRKRVQQDRPRSSPEAVIPTTTGVRGLPPPKARIPKPGPLPPPRAGLPPATLPPKAPRPPAPPAESGRRERPVRKGARTLVLGSVRDDGTTAPPVPEAAAPKPSAPPPPPSIEDIAAVDDAVDDAEDDATLVGDVPDLVAAAPPRAAPPESVPAAPLEEWEAVAEVAPAPFEPRQPEHQPPGAPPESLPPEIAPLELLAPESAPLPPEVIAPLGVAAPDPFDPPLSPPVFAASAEPPPLGEPDVAVPMRRPPFLALGLMVGGIVLVAGIGGLLVWLSSDSDVEPADTVAEGVTTEPVEAVEPAPELAPPVVEPPAPAAPPGPGPDDPVEGRDEDFDLAQLGITPREPPESRRHRNRARLEMIRRANRLRREGDLDAAEAEYHSLLGMFPDDTRGTAGLARVHLERGQPAEAVVFAQRLVRLRPRFSNNWVFLGDTLRDAGRRDAARRAYEHAVELEPRRGSARERLAEL